MTRKRSARTLKYLLYEASVQSPEWHAHYLPQFHTWLTGTAPRFFREDFCGTAKISLEWVLQSTEHTSLGLDLDPEPLRVARELFPPDLSRDAARRIRLRRQDVRKVTREKADMIGAYNFSCFTFLTRKELLSYFHAAHASLRRPGTLFLEVAGGPDFIEPRHESRKLSVPGVGKIRKIWEQHHYDPVTAICDYSIHFELPDGRWLQEAFHYHWRIWGIPELREALSDAGFRKTVVLWERTDARGKGLGELLPVETAELPHSFVAYLVALK